MVYLETPTYLIDNNPHAMIISQLEKRLISLSREVISEQIYYLPKNSKYKGKHEADILVIDNNKKYAYAIEVKATDASTARNKAKKQLKANREFLSRQGIKNVHLFYAYQDKNENPKKLYKIEEIIVDK